MAVYILSPHRDDACFSLALAISAWDTAGQELVVVNCFTRSRYAPFSDAGEMHPNDQMSYVSAWRQREDEAFRKSFRHVSMIDLNLKDAPIRLRCESDEVCERAMDAGDTAIPKIRKGLEKHMDPDGADGLLLPLALGRHVDHVVAREAGMPIAAGVPFAFYEDLPYAAREGVCDRIAEEAGELGRRMDEVLVPMILRQGDAVARKNRSVLAYSSQIDTAGADEISGFSKRYGGGERIWVNERWRAFAKEHRLDASAVEESEENAH